MSTNKNTPKSRPFTRTARLDEATIEELLEPTRRHHELMPFEEHVATFTTSSTLDDVVTEDGDRTITLSSTVRTTQWLTDGDVEDHEEDHIVQAILSPRGDVRLWIDGVRRPPRDQTIVDALPPGLSRLELGAFETTVVRRFTKLIGAQRPSRLMAEWIDQAPTTPVLERVGFDDPDRDVEHLREFFAEDHREYYVRAHPDIIDAFAEEPDIKAFAERLFASSRKDLVKALLSTEMTYLNVGYVLHDASMPIDALVRFLDACTTETSEPMLTDVSLLAEFSMTSRHKMLKNWRPDRDALPLTDLVAMIHNGRDVVAPTKEVKHLAEAESHMVALANTRYRERVRDEARHRRELDQRRADWLLTPVGIAWKDEQDEIERRRLAEIERMAAEAEENLRREHAHRVETYATLRHVLDGFTYLTPDGERLTIEVARDPQTLREWGNNLGTNCIGNGGYDHYITSMKAMLLGIHRGDVARDGSSVLYTADIRISDHPEHPSKLNQFRGYNNAMPVDDQWFDELLADNDIVITRK